MRFKLLDSYHSIFTHVIIQIDTAKPLRDSHTGRSTISVHSPDTLDIFRYLDTFYSQKISNIEALTTFERETIFGKVKKAQNRRDGVLKWLEMVR